MRRMIWFGIGAAAGYVAARRGEQAVEEARERGRRRQREPRRDHRDQGGRDGVPHRALGRRGRGQRCSTASRRAGRDALRVGTAGSLAHAQHRSPELTPERPDP